MDNKSSCWKFVWKKIEKRELLWERRKKVETRLAYLILSTRYEFADSGLSKTITFFSFFGENHDFATPYPALASYPMQIVIKVKVENIYNFPMMIRVFGISCLYLDIFPKLFYSSQLLLFQVITPQFWNILPTKWHPIIWMLFMSTQTHNL